MLCSVQRNSAVSRASSSTAPAAPLRALASAVPSTWASALRPDDLPDLLQILGERDLAPVGGLDPWVAAEDFERGPDAGEDEVGAADTFALQALHPVADALGQFAQDVGPVADRRVVGARAADEVDARGEGGRLSRAQARSPSRSRSATRR